MPPLELKPLSTLPRSAQQAYRVDAIGNIQRNPNCATNHLINVLLSPVVKGVRYKEILSSGSVDSSEQTLYQISVGELFLFSPGCVIRGGNLVWKPRLSNITEDLSISTDRVRFILPGDSSENGGFSIPPYIYKFGLASKSPLLAIERDGDPYSVLIPTMELLRFYYSGSSKLNQAIFSSTLIDLNEVINLSKSSFDRNTGTVTICLRQDYPSADAAMLGHWYSDEYAHRQILNVWNALMKFQHNEKISYLPLKIGFPFEGDTQISAQGIELPTPDGIKNKRKLLLTLIQCTHARPFSKLIYTRDNDRGPGALDEPGDRKESVGYRQKLETPLATQDGVNDPFSNPSINVQTDYLDVEDYRFPKIDIEKQVKDHTTHAAPNAKDEAAENLPNQSSSTGTHGNSDAITICILPKQTSQDEANPKNEAEHEQLPPDFETFQKVIDELKKYTFIASTEYSVVNPASIDKDAKLSRFPVTSRKKTIKWSVMKIEDKKPIARKAFLLNVQSQLGVHYLLEIERREYLNHAGKMDIEREFATYVFSNATCSLINNATLESLLLLLAESSFKNYKKRFESLGLTVFAKKHSGNICERAELIVEKMANRWNDVHPERAVTSKFNKNSTSFHNDTSSP